MSELTRNRMIGLLFFLSLLMILWQVLFAPSLDEPMDLRTELPLAPTFEKYTVKKPERSVQEMLDTQQKAVLVEKELLNPKKVDTEKDTKKSLVGAKQEGLLDTKLLPRHWSLRVASLRDRQKVKSLRNTLENLGYRNYTRQVSVDGKSYTRIYVGPKLKKDELLKIKSVIDNKLAVKSILVRSQSISD